MSTGALYTIVLIDKGLQVASFEMAELPTQGLLFEIEEKVWRVAVVLVSIAQPSDFKRFVRCGVELVAMRNAVSGWWDPVDPDALGSLVDLF